MSLGTVLLIVLVLVLVGALPGMPYTVHPYGYWPSSAVGVVVVILLILLLVGRI